MNLFNLRPFLVLKQTPFFGYFIEKFASVKVFRPQPVIQQKLWNETLAITIILITSTACLPSMRADNGNLVPPLVEEAVDDLVIQPESSAEATIPPTNSYTNIAEVDEAIALILRNSVADKRTLIEFTTVGCTRAEGLGGPPKCEEGVSEGSAITYFPILGPGEGQPVLPGYIDDVLDFSVEELVAVYRPSAKAFRSPDYPIGATSLLFTSLENELPVTVQLTNGRIVRLDFSAYPIEQMLQNLDGEILYSRYPSAEASSTATAVQERNSGDTAVVCLPRTSWPTYTVVAGDNLYNLARDLRTTVAELTKANCLDQSKTLLPGQSLYVPALPATATPIFTPTPTPLPMIEPEIVNFAIYVPVFRPGPGDVLKVIWETSGVNAQLCFNYALNIYSECQMVPSSGVLTHTLKSDDPVADHWLDITLEAQNANSSTSQSERVLLHCHNPWFAKGISDWCPTIGVQGSIANAQWFEGGVIIYAEQSAMVIFDEPGTPCLAYGFLPDLTMDTSFLLPPDGRFLPDPTLGKLYLGQFPMSETIRPRLGWATSDLLEFSWNHQCEQTSTMGQSSCFASAPDGRAYRFTAVSGAPDTSGVAVGSGVCPFVN